MVGNRLEDLNRHLRKVFLLSPTETMRRLSGRAVRYTRRVRNRRRPPRLTDSELLAALAAPTASIADLGSRRRGGVPLVPASIQSIQMARILGEQAPESLEPILASASAVAAGTFDLLGSGRADLGVLPDWHTDFKSGKRWDKEIYSLDILPTPGQGHDIKAPWELARLQHLTTLGIASALTGETRFQDVALAQITSFEAGNPAYRGVNWACTMDVALRAVGLLAAEGFLRRRGDDRFWAEMLGTLLVHARFILENLEDGPVRGNHFLTDLAGLYLCSLGLPEFRESAAWRTFAREALCSEMGRQVTREGFGTEASTSYHAFVSEMFLFPALFGSLKGDPFPAEYLSRLEKMLEVVALLIRPDGTLPQIGDNDDGRFLILSQYHRSRRDWKPLMALGAYACRRAEWLPLAADAWVEGAWVVGEPFLDWRNGELPSKTFPAFRSRSFAETGLCQLGTGSVQMVVDAGPVGQGGNGGHAHNDTLAFELYAFNQEILPDRGTGTYTPDLAIRNLFRSTRAHNTVRVDEAEINPLSEELFRLTAADVPRVLRWRSGRRWVYLSAEHSGYRRLPGSVVHRRGILLDVLRHDFLFEDRFGGEGHHHFEWSFHLPPGWVATVGETGWTARCLSGLVGIRFEWVRPLGGIPCRVEEDFHSPSYGVFQPARVIRIDWSGEVPCAIRYALIPFREQGR